MYSQDKVTVGDVAAWAIPGPPDDGAAPLYDALDRQGLMQANQTAGRHWPMGCVALEITQRCNLDCTLCYLSDISEAVRDLPLEEVLRRVDLIHAYYGPGTNVQITGGDPTLRDRGELIQIVARVAKRGMRPALFTNGIKAKRDLLTALRGAGLKDVAFHVDMTQQRKGYDSEAALNALRDDYIARAEGLGLHILFNTTVFDGNIADVPMLAAFFAARADRVHLASFQMQADTGRGVLRARGQAITKQRVMDLISEGAGHPLGFDDLMVGHPSCNRYAGLLSAGGVTTPIFDHPALLKAVFERSAPFAYDRYSVWRSVKVAASFLARHPGITARVAGYIARKAWALKRGLLKFKRPHKLTFYIHNFMDAAHLEKDRCEACIFMTMTADGPISMCVHNAKRDDFILADVETRAGTWRPLQSGNVSVKTLKGRRRAGFLKERRAASIKLRQHHAQHQP